MFRQYVPDIAKETFAHHQDMLIDKLNEYITEKNLQIFRCLEKRTSNLYVFEREYKNLNQSLLPKGFCQGLAAIWLKKMAEGKEHSFYDLRDKVLQLSGKELCAYSGQLDVFIRDLKKAQDPAFLEPHLTQSATERVIGVKKELSCGYSFNAEELAIFIEQELTPGRMLIVAGSAKRCGKHAVALFNRDGKIFMYDANEPYVNAEITKDAQEAARFIRRTVYEEFGTHPDKMKLEMDFYRKPYTRMKRQEASEMPAESIQAEPAPTGFFQKVFSFFSYSAFEQAAQDMIFMQDDEEEYGSSQSPRR